jgi:hypothetical protein
MSSNYKTFGFLKLLFPYLYFRFRESPFSAKAPFSDQRISISIHLYLFSYKKMFIFSPLILLASALGTQAASILPTDKSTPVEFISKREPVFLAQHKRSSPVKDILTSVMHSVKRSLSEMDGGHHQEGNLGGQLVKRMMSHLSARDGRAPLESFVGEAVDLVKRSMDETTLNELHDAAEYTQEYLKSDDVVKNLDQGLKFATQFMLRGDGLLMKALGFVFGLLREAHIIEDIVKIVTKVTRVIVSRLFQIGSSSRSQSGYVGSKAPASASAAVAGGKSGTVVPVASKAPALSEAEEVSRPESSNGEDA